MEDSQQNISFLVFDIEAVADGDLIALICVLNLKRRFRGLPQRLLAVVVYDSTYPVFEVHLVEVDQQTNL